MPVFYTPDNLDDSCSYWTSPACFILQNMEGFGRSIKDYNLKLDADGIPLISECSKHDFF